MNEHIMKILFGNQKQAMRQNEAIVNFMENYLTLSEVCNVDLSTYGQTLETITNSLNDLIANIPTSDWVIADDLFVQYLLGVEAYRILKADVECNIELKTLPSSPKVVFILKPRQLELSVEDEVSYAVRELYNRAEQWGTDDNTQKALSAEDEAYALAHTIVEACPPARRSVLPEDEVLAAVLLAKEYYAAGM